MTEMTAVNWIESTSWEPPFFGLPQRIPWPADADPAGANADPFEVEHLLRAIDLLGPEAGAPWTTFRAASELLEDLAEAMEDGEIVQATELLEKVEAIHPGTAFVLYHRGVIARQEGRDPEALEFYRAASQKAPKVGAIWNNMGAIQAFTGEREEAIAAFKKALECSPQDPMALEGLAQLRELVRLQANDPNNPKAVAYVDIPTFRRLTTEQIPQMAQNPDNLVAFGEQLLRDGLVPDVGLMALERAAEVRPDHSRTLLPLAAAYRLTGQHDKARATVTRYTEMNPQDAAGYFHLAQTCNAAGDEAAEKAALDKTLELEPNHQAALGVRLALSPNENDPAKEEELAKWGAEHQSWMAFLMASSVARTRGDSAGALRHAERAVELNGESEEVLLHYAATLGEAREITKLAAIIKPAVESGRYSKRLDWNYAQVLKEMGLTNDALAVLRKGVAEPNAPEEFKRMAHTMIDAWMGYLAGSGIRLEVHPAGFLARPVLITLGENEEGGVLLNPGSPFPAEARFPWKATGDEATVLLQQGQRGKNAEPHYLGAFKVRGFQPGPDGTATIQCQIVAQSDGGLHFRAIQNGRKLPVGWVNQPHTTLV